MLDGQIGVHPPIGASRASSPARVCGGWTNIALLQPWMAKLKIAAMALLGVVA
jgi:hypothetical protein